MDLRAALVIWEAKAVQTTEAPVWNIQLGEEAVVRALSEEMQEKSQKDDILKVCAKAQKVDKDGTYGMPFDWAEDFNPFTLIVPDEPAP